MKTSIIIAVKTWQKNLEECVAKCARLEHDVEVIVLPDQAFDSGLTLPANVRVIPTGNITPPYKRDLGCRQASGEIIALLDDDAYPADGWLQAALRLFSDPSVAAVCGPAVTPPSDSFAQKASGLVYNSFVVSCGQVYRYHPRHERRVVDYPSCNFLVRKTVFDRVGGFDTPYWPGEDTFLCLKILRDGGQMIYHPDVLVYHHRRSLFRGHVHQVRNYALHRGFFAKKYPETSFRWDYFIPSFFVLGAVGGGLLSFIPWIRASWLSVLALYAALIVISGVASVAYNTESLARRFQLLSLVILGIIVTHTVYGIYFLAGLAARKMPEVR